MTTVYVVRSELLHRTHYAFMYNYITEYGVQYCRILSNIFSYSVFDCMTILYGVNTLLR